MKISILIPVYNEEKTVIDLLRKVLKIKFPAGVESEIVVVDDGSKDGSWDLLKKIVRKTRKIKTFRHRVNRGKGAAIRTAISKASGDVLVIQDADLEYNPDDIPKLVKPILGGKYRVVYGSRLIHYPLRLFGRKKTPLLTHYLGNKFLTLMTNILYGQEITDMETCYKAFERSVIKSLDLKAEKFDIEPEITSKILKRNIKIYEIPIKVRPRGYEEGKKISWKDGFSALWTLLRYRFTD